MGASFSCALPAPAPGGLPPPDPPLLPGARYRRPGTPPTGASGAHRIQAPVWARSSPELSDPIKCEIA
eukprot:15465403-Alexandrium_andersonii.AAC.1